MTADPTGHCCPAGAIDGTDACSEPSLWDGSALTSGWKESAAWASPSAAIASCPSRQDKCGGAATANLIQFADTAAAV